MDGVGGVVEPGTAGHDEGLSADDEERLRVVRERARVRHRRGRILLVVVLPVVQTAFLAVRAARDGEPLAPGHAGLVLSVQFVTIAAVLAVAERTSLGRLGRAMLREGLDRGGRRRVTRSAWRGEVLLDPVEQIAAMEVAQRWRGLRALHGVLAVPVALLVTLAAVVGSWVVALATLAGAAVLALGAEVVAARGRRAVGRFRAARVRGWWDVPS